MKQRLTHRLNLYFLGLLWLLVNVPAHADYGNDAFQLILKARGMARTGKRVEAIKMLQESRLVAEQAEQNLLAAIALNNIAEIYRGQGNTGEALKYYRQALVRYRVIAYQNGITTTRQQIDKILLQAGEVQKISIDKREALIREALKQVKNRVKDQRKDQAPRDALESQNTAYIAGVKRGIVRVWNYPEKASQVKAEGKVKVEFTILKDGQLGNVHILYSSGNISMDQEAIRAVKAAAPFHRIPDQLEQKRMTIEFTFNYVLENPHDRMEPRK
ncbi:MAG: TonB family protein [Candidatus Binatia bacterium]